MMVVGAVWVYAVKRRHGTRPVTGVAAGAEARPAG